MKHKKLIILLPIFALLNACSATLSNDHSNGHHRHNSVSVGVHAQGSGSGGLAALIIGGIIGAVINEASHESNEKEFEQKKLAEKNAKEKLELEQRLNVMNSQENIDRRRLTNTSQAIKWYQLGKDKQCYEMQTRSGITDILASVDFNYCNP